nr:hypothetical protein BaRGS_014618 [Batillaria attramentaria]
MEQVEKLLVQQDQRIRLLETEKRQLQHSVGLLSEENLGLKDSVSLLVARTSLLISENENLKDSVSKLTVQNSDLGKRVATGDIERQELKNGLKLLTEKCLESETLSPVTDNQSVHADAASQTTRDLSPRSDDTNTLETVVNQLSQRVTEVNADVQALKNANSQQDAAIQEAGSSVYVRWGRSTCPSTSSLVYSGVIGGSYYDHTGAATNYLCLSLSPVLSSHTVPAERAYLYGGEYQTYDTHMEKDAVCAVCRSQHPTTIMAPGTNVCQPGWTRQYSGYLMAGYAGHHAGTEYICVDSALESADASTHNDNGKLLYYTVTRCGSLPCDPYVNNKVVTCAVCSK